MENEFNDKIKDIKNELNFKNCTLSKSMWLVSSATKTDLHIAGR